MSAPEKISLNIRDIALRDNFTASEKLCFLSLFFTFIILTWNTDIRSITTSCILLIIGTSSLINIRIHDIVHPFVVDRLWTKLLLLNIPSIILLIIYLLTALGSRMELLTIGDTIFLELIPNKNLFNTNVAFKEN